MLLRDGRVADDPYLEEDQVRGGSRGTHQVCLAAVLRVRIGLQDGFEMREEFREPLCTVRLCPGSRFRFLIFVIVADVDWVMHVVRLGA